MSACTGVVSSSHNERKIGCESLADDDPPPTNPPPEPFLLSAEAELDWIDRNAFIERKESDEGAVQANINPNPNPNPNPLPPSTPSGSNFGSQRHNSANVKSKPLVIGFPKPQKSGSYREGKSRRPASIRLFPKRSQSSSSGRKSGVSMAEPSSPKVSCIGRVRSKRDRSRRKKIGSQKQSEQPITRSKSQKRGFWSSFRCIFRSRNRKHPKIIEQVSEPPVADPPPLAAVKRFSSARRSDAWAADLEADHSISLGGVKRFSSGRRSDAFAAELEVGGGLEPPDPPGIGAVKRFTSGRRSDAWAADLETTLGDPPSLGAVKRFSSGRRSDAWAGDVNGAKSEPLDHISILQRKVC